MSSYPLMGERSLQSGLARRYLFPWKFLVSEFLARLAIALVGIIFAVSGYVFIRRVVSEDWALYAYPFETHQIFPEILTGVYLLCWYVFTAVIIVLLLRFYGKWTNIMLVEELTLSLLGITLCGLMTWTTGELIKRMFGRPRPDFLSRCFGKNDPNEWMADHGWTSWNDIPEIPNCTFPTVSHYEAVDGRQAFPSAHAGLTSTIMVFLALWLYSKLSYFRNVGAWRIVLPTIYCGFALAVAVSRTSDYRHHPSDVVAGLIIGSTMAIIATAFYFPMKLEPLGARVYRIRTSNNGPRPQVRPRIRYRAAAKFDGDSSDSDEAMPQATHAHSGMPYYGSVGTRFETGSSVILSPPKTGQESIVIEDNRCQAAI